MGFDVGASPKRNAQIALAHVSRTTSGSCHPCTSRTTLKAAAVLEATICTQPMCAQSQTTNLRQRMRHSPFVKPALRRTVWVAEWSLQSTMTTATAVGRKIANQHVGDQPSQAGRTQSLRRKQQERGKERAGISQRPHRAEGAGDQRRAKFWWGHPVHFTTLRPKGWGALDMRGMRPRGRCIHCSSAFKTQYSPGPAYARQCPHPPAGWPVRGCGASRVVARLRQKLGLRGAYFALRVHCVYPTPS